jgi:hypothetical protein
MTFAHTGCSESIHHGTPVIHGLDLADLQFLEPEHLSDGESVSVFLIRIEDRYRIFIPGNARDPVSGWFGRIPPQALQVSVPEPELEERATELKLSG